MKIIAENAQGFEGNPDIALDLLRCCAASGADAAKFQMIYADELCTPDYKDRAISEKVEMPDYVWENLVLEAKKIKIEIIFDVFGAQSLKLVDELGCKSVMIHATDLNNIIC